MVFFIYIFTQRAALDQNSSVWFSSIQEMIIWYIYFFLNVTLMTAPSAALWDRPHISCVPLYLSGNRGATCGVFHLLYDLWPLCYLTPNGVCRRAAAAHSARSTSSWCKCILSDSIWGEKKKMSSRNKNNAGFSAAVRRRRGRGLTPICWPHLWTRCCHSVTNRSGSTSLWENPFLKAVWASMFPRKGLTVCLVTTVL